MIAPPTPANEIERLQALHALSLSPFTHEERFDRLTRIAARVLDVPVVLISIVEADRQWFKSISGADWSETPRELSFCGHTILGESTMEVPDTLCDARFADNPAVTGASGVRFYAGFPLETADGFRVGAFCAIDTKPRHFSADQHALLKDLAMLVQEELNSVKLHEALERVAAGERALREERQTLDALMNYNPCVVFIKDSEGRMVFVNRRGDELFGYGPGELYGKRDDEWLPEAFAHATMENDRQVLASGRVAEFLETIPSPDGQSRQWLVFKFPIVRESGELLLGAIAADISERVAAEKALGELSTLQWAILDAADFAILSTDPRGIIRTFNSTAERWLGYSASEVVGCMDPMLFHDAREMEQRVAAFAEAGGGAVTASFEFLMKQAREGPREEREWTYRRRDGSRFPVMLSVTALWDAQGGLSGYLEIARDITLQKQSEESMRLAKEAAEQANRAKSQFLANMSHEVRTPLNGILGVNAMLLETALQPEQRHLVDTVQSSGHALLSIVNDILEFSKIEAGHLKLDLDDFSLPELVKGVVDLNTARASRKGVVILMKLAETVPQAVHGDPGRLRQVLNNLVGNAVKFSERGLIEISIEPEAGEFFRVEVRDEGIGISKEAQTQVFEAFVQADSSTTRNYGGTGLGLSICRQLVGLMGGEIGLESRLGGGSTFWFTVPLRPALTRLSKPAPEVPGEADLLLAGRPLRVLLAEDNRINRMVAVHQLKGLGCKVEAVENGQAVLDMLEKEAFDIVLMDCQMPIMDGYTATEEIRRREAGLRHTWIVALTANAMSGERERCLALGMDDYLSKPFRRAELVAVVRQIALRIAAQSRVDAESPISAAEIAQFRELGAEVLSEMVELYRLDSQKTLLQIGDAVVAGNCKKILGFTHKLKGGSTYFGAARLDSLCENLEQLARACTLEAMPELFEELQREARVVLAALDVECARAR